MGVLAIFMSLSDSPGATISTLTTKFDSEISDFAWHNPSTTVNGTNYTMSHVEAAGDIIWYHMMVISDTQGSSQLGRFHIFADAVGKPMMIIDMTTGGVMRIQALGTTTVSSSTIAEPTTKTRWDIKIDMSGTDVVCELYINGEASATLSATAPVSNTGKPANITLALVDANNFYTSELYVADFDTRNTRPVKQVPDAVGNHTAWTGGFADLGDEDVKTGARADTGLDKLTMNLELYPGPASPAGIKEVVVKMIGAKGATGPTNIRPMVRISATDYFEANLNPTAEVPLAMYGTWALNPNTAADWVVGDLDTTEFGVEAVT